MSTEQKIENKLRYERRLKLAAFLAIHVVGVFFLLTVDNLLLSFVLAFVINYMLAPIVNGLERYGLSRTQSTLVPFLISAAAIGTSFYLLVPLFTDQLTTLEAQIPKYRSELIALIGQIETRLRLTLNVQDLKFSEIANDWLIGKTAELSSWIPSVVSDSLTVMLLAPFLGYFMLQDGRRISRALLEMVPNNLFELALNLHHQINSQMGSFIRARILEAAIVGLVCWVGFVLIGFPYATLLAVFAGLTNLIPYIGPVIGAVPGILIALISEEGAIYASTNVNLFVIASIYFIAQLIDNVFLIPLLVARIVNLHPVTVILALIIGAQAMGILGMVISIPVASVLKVTLGAVYNHLLEFRS